MEQCFVPKYEMGIERVINCCTDPFPFFTLSPAAKKSGWTGGNGEKIEITPLNLGQ